MAQLEVKNLHVSIKGKEILKGVSLSINKGEIHALMGPNGSGKSTLALSIMGHPGYSVTSGDIFYEGESIIHLPVFERAKKKIFLAFQYPSAITGVSVASFIRAAYLTQNKNVNFAEFSTKFKEKMALLKIDNSFVSRYINDGFSGGEKKKSEILQLAMLSPHLSLLDETDSGLDIDALRIVAEGVNAIKTQEMSVLVVTHYQRILNYLKPDFVHILYQGQIIKSGGADLALLLEGEGYEKIIEDFKKGK